MLLPGFYTIFLRLSNGVNDFSASEFNTPCFVFMIHVIVNLSGSIMALLSVSFFI